MEVSQPFWVSTMKVFTASGITSYSFFIRIANLLSPVLVLSALSRHRPVSAPGNVRRRVSRGGSVSKSKQRQTAARPAASRQLLAAAVASPGRLSAASTSSSTSSLAQSGSAAVGGRERQRHRSAPAGRPTTALAHALSLDPAASVRGPTGEESPLHAALTARPGVGALASRRHRRASDSLRKDVLRSVSMERSRKMSMMSDGAGAEVRKENALLTGKAGPGPDEFDGSASPFLNGDYGGSFKRVRITLQTLPKTPGIILSSKSTCLFRDLIL